MNKGIICQNIIEEDSMEIWHLNGSLWIIEINSNTIVTCVYTNLYINNFPAVYIIIYTVTKETMFSQAYITYLHMVSLVLVYIFGLGKYYLIQPLQEVYICYKLHIVFKLRFYCMASLQLALRCSISVPMCKLHVVGESCSILCQSMRHQPPWLQQLVLVALFHPSTSTNALLTLVVVALCNLH